MAAFHAIISHTLQLWDLSSHIHTQARTAGLLLCSCVHLRIKTV